MFTWVAECVYVGCDRSQVSGSHKDPHPCPCNSTWFQSRPLETSQWCARFVSYNLNSNFSARQWWTAMNYKSLRMTHDRHISTVLHAFCCSCNHQFLLWKQVSLATTSVCRSSISRKGHSLCLLQIPNTVHSFWECEHCGFLQQGQQRQCPSCRQFLHSENGNPFDWHTCI